MNNITFTSRNNPVPNFEIKTNKGILKVEEISTKDKKIDKETIDATDFFVYNFATNTKDPSFLKYLDMPKSEYKKSIKKFSNYMKNMFNQDDGNLTYLIAKDSKGNVQARCITKSLDDFGGISDKNTLCVDSVAVNKEYRGNNVGSIMVNKIIEQSKDQFKDIFLVADNCAVPSYKKGWKLEEFKPENENQEKVFNIIKEERPDYPEYVTFMHKPINTESSRWWERFEKLLEKKEKAQTPEIQ